MKTLDFMQTREMLLHTAAAIIAAKPELTEIDSKIGDGDHGIGMELGMKKASAQLEQMQNGDNVFSLFSEMGKAMLMSMGGASGVIFGTLFMGGAKGKNAASLDCRALAQWLEDSRVAIQKRGGANVGDKTMVDALVPAAAAAMSYTGDDLAEMLSLAEEAAKQGVEETKQYQAKFGRAKSLMERSIGYQDAGATSTWIILKAMREYCEGVK